jgi:UDP-N-acetylmuramyl pentapeptide synthase
MAAETAQAARQAGLPEVKECPGVTEAAARLDEWLRPGDMVLIKASRSAALERVGQLLRARQAGEQDSGQSPGG